MAPPDLLEINDEANLVGHGDQWPRNAQKISWRAEIKWAQRTKLRNRNIQSARSFLVAFFGCGGVLNYLPPTLLSLRRATPAPSNHIMT